ncbi:MAG TPA: hypothetical protein EYN66_21610 [Myxococcales bacterium]|nr:hypothetical protein [Myxococcales bacterium]
MGFHIGISTPLGGVFADKVAFGATFYVPLIRLTRAETVDHGVPQFVMYENLQDKLLVLVGLAAQPWDWLNLGIGMQIMSDVSGDSNVQISLTDRQVTRRQMAIDLHAELSMTAGLSADLIEGLTLGVSFRESTSLHYRVPIYALIEEIGTLTFDIEGKSMFTPHQLNAGVNWRLPWLPLTLAADLTWAMWSMAPSPVPHAIIQIDNSQMIADAPEGTVAKKIIDIKSQPVPLEAQDIVIPRLGLEYQLGAFELRCGYFYRPTPVPTQVYQTNFADSDAHVFTFGAAWTGTDPFNAFRKPVTLGLGFQWTQLSARRVDKVDSNDATGDYFIKGGIFSVGFDLQHDF